MQEDNKALVPIENGMLVPKDFDGLWRLVSVVCQTKMAGPYKGQPEDAFVACQLGMSVGMNYMQSLQSVAVIEGKPSLYGNATTALCEASGFMEEHDEYWEVDGERQEDYDGGPDLNSWPDDVKAIVMMKRQSVKQVKISKFSVGDAKRMGKWNKPTKNGYLSVWQKHPKDMLMWRARHKTQSVVFADVLKGFLPAMIAKDYEATDIEEVEPNVYETAAPTTEDPPPEVKEYKETVSKAKSEKNKIAKDMQFIIDFAKENKLSVARLEEFINIIAKENSTTITGLIGDINSRKEEFVSMFKTWDESTGGYVGEPDREPEVSDEHVDHKEVSGSETQENEPQDPEVLPGMDRTILNISFYQYVANNEEALADESSMAKLDEYIEYCSEMTKKPEEEILRLANDGPENFFQYFFNWLPTNVEIIPEEPTFEIEPNESPAPDLSKKCDVCGMFGGAHSRGCTAVLNHNVSKDPAPKKTTKKTYSDFVAEFKNMPAPRFKKFVMDNHSRFENCEPEDLKEAVRKWETLRGKGKLDEDWPFPQRKSQMDFSGGETGTLNAKMRVANLKQTNASEAEQARKELGFATSVSEGASLIWEQKIHEIIEKKAKKAARGRKK